MNDADDEDIDDPTRPSDDRLTWRPQVVVVVMMMKMMDTTGWYAMSRDLHLTEKKNN